MRRALAGLTALAVIGSVGFFVAAQAAVITPTITLLPACGSVGSTLTVSGRSFAPGIQNQQTFPITVWFDPGGSPESKVLVPPGSIDATGSWTATLTVPQRPLRYTPYQVVAVQTVGTASPSPPPPTPGGRTGNEITAWASFSLPCVGLTLEPNCGSVGLPIVVRGAGWRPDITVSIALTPPVGAKPDVITAPAQDTTFAVNLVVTQRPPGAYTVVATQAAPPSAVALPPVIVRAEFLIPCVKAVIKLVPDVGPPGTVTTVTGVGFPVGAVVKLSWTLGIPISAAPITIGSGQGFQLTILIYPHDELGLRHMRAGPDLSVANAPLFNIASADFLVVPGTAQPHDFSWRR